MDIILPYPPAANLSPLGRARKTAYAERCRGLLSGSVPMRGDLYMAARFYPSRHPAGDLDNLLKTLLDTLKGFAFVDDNQVRAMYVLMMDFDKNNPRVELRISAYRPQKQQHERILQ